MKSNSCGCSIAYLMVISSAIMNAAHSRMPAPKAILATGATMPMRIDARSAQAKRHAALNCHASTPTKSTRETQAGGA
jgi:hypothetical protein